MLGVGLSDSAIGLGSVLPHSSISSEAEVPSLAASALMLVHAVGVNIMNRRTFNSSLR